jgi:hypothetical protein
VVLVEWIGQGQPVGRVWEDLPQERRLP